MITPSQLLRRLRALFGSRRLDDAMDEEMRFHLDMEAEAEMRSGLSAPQAVRQARVSFGGVERYREEGRDARGVRGLHDLAGDLRYAVRMLRRSPIFTLVAVITLGLGIGANTAIFSVVNTVLLQPLPYPDPERLVKVWGEGHSRAEFTRIRDRARSFERVAAYLPAYGMSLSGDGDPLRVVTALVSADFFSLLGVSPASGRFFRPGEDLPGTEPVAVLSFGLWRDRFGADPSIAGRTIELEGVRWTVIGVAPREFGFPGPETRLWVPLTLDEKDAGPFWGAYGHHLIARLAPAVTPEQARAEVETIAAALRLENPIWRPDQDYTRGITVNSLQDHLVADSRRLLGVLLGAVGLVLLIACANVANLLLVRGTARERELAIRATLGAGTRRLTRQLLVECGVLAAIGGAGALALAVAGTRALIRLLPASTPRLADVSLDGTTLGFTVLLTFLTALAFGLLPALRLARTDAQATLAGDRSTAGSHPRRLAGFLVSVQIALAVVLAVGAGLLVRSLSLLLDVDPGFETARIATARVSPAQARLPEEEAARAYYRQLLEGLGTAPGIETAAITTQLPFDQTNRVMAMWIDGWTTDPNRLDLFEVRKVSPELFRAMGIPLRKGRGFSGEDHATSPRVAIVSETALRRFWAGREIIGGRIRYPWPGWMTVVGVAADVRNNDLRENPLPTIYIPFEQDPEVSVTVVARATGDPRRALSTIRATVTALSPDVPVSDAEAMERLIERSVAAPRSACLLLIGFGLLALVLGAVGTYGLIAYGVERRTREIAVRMAVGARRNAVVRMIVREGARLAGLGILAGLVVAFGLARFMQGLLYEVGPTDPVVFAVAPLVLGLTALLACLVPALKAARIEPSMALKRE